MSSNSNQDERYTEVHIDIDDCYNNYTRDKQTYFSIKFIVNNADSFFANQEDDEPLWSNPSMIAQSETLIFDPTNDAKWLNNIDFFLEHSLHLNETARKEVRFSVSNYFEYNPEPASLKVTIDQIVWLVVSNNENQEVDQVLSGKKRPRPAEEHEIAVLKRVKVEDMGFKDDENYSCSIWLNDMANKEKDLTLTCTPCKHAFYGDCILKWLKTSTVCPICRFDLGSMFDLEAKNEVN